MKSIEINTNTSQTEMASKESSTALQELILSAPTWSDSDFNDYNEARKHINKSRMVSPKVLFKAKFAIPKFRDRKVRKVI